MKMKITISIIILILVIGLTCLAALTPNNFYVAISLFIGGIAILLLIIKLIV